MRMRCCCVWHTDREGDLYSNELLGENKIKESLRSLLRSSSVLNVNFGRIVVAFGEAFSLKEYTAKHTAEVRDKGVWPTPAIPTVYTPTPTAAGGAATAAAAEPVFSAASFTSPFTETKAAAAPKARPSSSSASAASAAAAAESKAVVQLTPAGTIDMSSYDPFSRSERDRKVFNRTLAYRVVYALSGASEAMATHLLATLMLMYRQGITRTQLIAKLDWLRHEIMARGGTLSGLQGEFRGAAVDHGMWVGWGVCCGGLLVGRWW
jgi:hypothetical protein